MLNYVPSQPKLTLFSTDKINIKSGELNFMEID